mmetsp:Transcript_34052/g.105157  ORF Transcript_34052/g.105157 Transcript_34052/m.105157 type:complete len:254 (-) Transcript_34052:1335-2096(-)
MKRKKGGRLRVLGGTGKRRTARPEPRRKAHSSCQFVPSNEVSSPSPARRTNSFCRRSTADGARVSSNERKGRAKRSAFALVAAVVTHVDVNEKSVIADDAAVGEEVPRPAVVGLVVEQRVPSGHRVVSCGHRKGDRVPLEGRLDDFRRREPGARQRRLSVCGPTPRVAEERVRRHGSLVRVVLWDQIIVAVVRRVLHCPRVGHDAGVHHSRKIESSRRGARDRGRFPSRDAARGDVVRVGIGDPQWPRLVGLR